jgi:phenylacetic acid degradation operon negative regulatory protein
VSDLSQSLAFGAGDWATQPRQLISTIYGTYAPRDSGWLPIAGLVDLMGDLGVDEQSVRSAVYRLKRQHVLTAKRVDNSPGYTFEGLSEATIHEGDARIYGRHRARPDDGWLLIVFSIPEEERAQRTRLRANLVQRGFGTVTSGVWIAPSHLFDETRNMLVALGLDQYVETFLGYYLEPDQLRRNAQNWWDFDQLHSMYQGFIERHRPENRRRKANKTISDRDAFTYYMRLLTDWRRLPYGDPGLPLEIVGEQWIGIAAQDLFHELRERYEAPAMRHAQAAIEHAQRVRRASGQRKTAAVAR